MLSKGDCVVFGNHGLCEVKDILVPAFLERGNETLYYSMVSSIDTKGVIFVPVEGAEDKMREAIDADEAEELINEIDELEVYDIPAGKKAEAVIVDVIKRNKAPEMMCLVKSLRGIKAKRAAEGKKFASMDEKYLSIAEKLLYSEMAYSMESKLDAIKERVTNELSQLTLA
ncbi:MULTISPECIES: CarD family transcriptional regulator [unclassified Butyrivibrio]|jgi:CarD family transcriptional regulator|uniref:CarD family transcriptional regulator n=1 Tax=unclassified Butyrivibrio TaxID=2639466 RepID=UPI000403FFE3|nr:MULTISPECIES: CarD family transcriptional regulator [unclassified Butyrivibrio]